MSADLSGGPVKLVGVVAGDTPAGQLPGLGHGLRQAVYSLQRALQPKKHCLDAYRQRIQQIDRGADLSIDNKLAMDSGTCFTAHGKTYTHSWLGKKEAAPLLQRAAAQTALLRCR